MRCPVCNFENRQGARFCNECGAALQAFACPTCGAINSPNAKFCNECGARLAASGPTLIGEDAGGTAPTPAGWETGGTSRPPVGAVADATPRPPAVPTQAEKDPTLLPLDGEERRVVTILFADMMGSTALAERLDPEEERLLKAGYFSAMAQAIHRHGGTIEKFIGDAVMAVFGIPSAHEDDPDRAVRAAFEMLAALQGFNERRLADDPQAPPIQIRIGINTGEVVAASNATEGGQFLVTGDAVNVAARLQQHAQPGTILVGSRTYRSTRGAMVYQGMPPIEVKGKTGPLQVWQAINTVDDQAAPTTQRLRGLNELPAPFIGRAPELALLNALYERVIEDRRPHLITLLGAPGVGKSRLVREWMSLLRGGPDARTPGAAAGARPGGVPPVSQPAGAGPGGVPSASSPVWIGPARQPGDGVVQVSRPAGVWPGDVARATRPPGDGVPLVSRPAGLGPEPGAVPSATVPTRAGMEPLVLEGRCPPYGAGITYWPLAEILRNYCGFTGEDAPQTARERLLRTVQEVVNRDAQNQDLAWLVRQLAFTIGLETPETPPLKTGGDSKEQRETLFRAWRIFFETLARRQPLLVFIDDIHWADDTLLDLLEYLAQRVSDVPLLLICPARPDLLDKRAGWGGGKRNFTTLMIEPLSIEQSHQLIDAMISPQGLPSSLRSSILAKAEGNPFFVEEIVRMLIDRGLLVCVNESWQVVQQDPNSTYHELLSLSLPDTIQGVLAARQDFLSPREKRLLQHAAVAGRTFWKGALACLAQEMNNEVFNLALENLRRKDFLLENERPTGMTIEQDVQYTFKHVLMRDVAYGSIPRARRVREHARMAEWLEHMAAERLDEFIELLAYHYHQAAITWSQTLSGQTLTHRPARAQTQVDLRQKAITYLTQAGDDAMGKYAANQAVHHYIAALDLLNASEQDHGLRYHLHEKLGRAYFVLSDGDAAWEHYRQALAEAQPTSLKNRAHLYHHLTMLATRWRSTFKQPPDLQVVRCYLDEGLALLKDQPDDTLLALLLASEAFWYLRAYFQQQADETAIEHAIASAERAASIAEKLSHPRHLSEVLDALSNVYANISDFHAFLEVQKRRLALVERIRDRAEVLDIYFTASKAYEMLSEYPQALVWADKAMQEAERMNSRRKLCWMLAVKTMLYFEWDKWDEAVQWGEKLVALCEQYNLLAQNWLAAHGIKSLAIVYYRMGQDERGDHYAQMVEDALPHFEQAPNVAALLAHLRLAQDRLAEARELLQRIIAHFPGIESLQVQSQLAELAALLGDDAAFDALPPSIFTLTERSGSRKELAGLIRARGMMRSRRGEFAPANDDFQAALAIYRELGTRWEEGLTLEALATHLYRTTPGEASQEATARLESAQTIYEELHAEPALARVRSLLRTGGLRLTQDLRPSV